MLDEEVADEMVRVGCDLDGHVVALLLSPPEIQPLVAAVEMI